MDKQMIEDVRQDLEDINGTDGIHILGYIPLAKNLIEKGYRKIPEGAVVIEKSEYEKLRLLADECLDWRRKNCNVGELPKENAVVLMGMETEQQFEDLMVAFDEMCFMPYTTHPFPEEYVETWKQRLIFVFGQLRKETAEKFAERLFETFDEYFMCDKAFIERKIVEICKEITEGEV